MARKKLAPIHPGEILLEEFLAPLEISQYRLAKDISVPPRRPSEPQMLEKLMKRLSARSVLMTLALAGCTAPEADMPDRDPAVIEAVLEDIRIGWEEGDGAPFYTHFLDWEGARYFEGGGENTGLRDLVENHVEPEAELGLRLGFSNIQTHFEGNFAWAVVDTDIQLTTSDGRDIHNRGHGTYLFRWVDGAWRVVHTQSASSPVRTPNPGG